MKKGTIMKKLLPILLLPLFVFIACGDDDDDDICIDLKADVDASAAVYNTDEGFTTANCNIFYDDLIALLNEGCDEEILSEVFTDHDINDGQFENFTADTAVSWKDSICPYIDSLFP